IPRSMRSPGPPTFTLLPKVWDRQTVLPHIEHFLTLPAHRLSLVGVITAPRRWMVTRCGSGQRTSVKHVPTLNISQQAAIVAGRGLVQATGTRASARSRLEPDL